MSNRIVALPSGAKLEIQAAPFLDSKALYQAVLEEAKFIKMDTGDFGVENMVKDILCTGLSSKRVEAALEKCMGRALYNSLPIKADTFEPVEARQDYIPVLMEVAQENIKPFTKSLFAQLKGVMDQLKILASAQA